MSRCFPFPPPGYAGKCASNDALIVSIKLQREREKSISDREQQKVKSSDKKKRRGVEKIKSSDKKKDRKREKKDKKDKLKVHSAVDSEKQKTVEKLHNATNGGLVDSKNKQNLQKLELLEQSNLTEEHGPPVESQNVSCSSDSTGSSGKRKSHSSPPSSIQGNGNKIRIRISSQKKGDPTTSGSTRYRGEEHCTLQSNGSSCSTLVRTESSISQKPKMSIGQEPYCAPSFSTTTLQLAQREDKEARASQQRETISVPAVEAPSTSGKNEPKQPSRKLSSHEKKMLKKETLYNSLFENLVPLSLPSDQIVLDEDEEWLLSKKEVVRPAKRLRGNDELEAHVHNLPCSTSAEGQPRAQYLADVGVYALPFTVPF